LGAQIPEVSAGVRRAANISPLRVRSQGRNRFSLESVFCGAGDRTELVVMRSILLWLIGIPIPIILLLALCTHHF